MLSKKNLSEEIKEDVKTTKTSKNCCGNHSIGSTSQPNQSFAISNNPPKTPVELTKTSKTQIVIKYDVGFKNSLYLRGKGANLNWEKGVSLKNVKFDEWIWETDLPFTTAEFKVLINDRQYETGSNHVITYGSSTHYTPQF